MESYWNRSSEGSFRGGSSRGSSILGASSSHTPECFRCRFSYLFSGLDTATSSREASVEYDVQIDDDEKVRIFLGSSGYNGDSPAVGLLPERSRDTGFFLALEILSPDSILSFLRGEIGRREFRIMLQRARGADKNMPKI